MDNMDILIMFGGDILTTMLIHYLAGQQIFLSLYLILLLRYTLWYTVVLLGALARHYEFFVPIHDIMNETLYEFLNYPILLVIDDQMINGHELPDDNPLQDDLPQEVESPLQEEL